MNIYLISIFTFLTFNIVNGQNNSEQNRYNGFEIYFIKDFKGSEHSWLDFDKKEHRRFKRKYETLTHYPDSICNWFVNLEKSQIEENPFLVQTDIEYYSPDSNQIKLTESGVKKINQLKSENISVFGKPFIIVANGKKLIGAWFWSLFSSSGCDRIYYMIEEGTDQIHLSKPACGKDPRNDRQFLNELNKL